MMKQPDKAERRRASDLRAGRHLIRYKGEIQEENSAFVAQWCISQRVPIMGGSSVQNVAWSATIDTCAVGGIVDYLRVGSRRFVGGGKGMRGCG